MASENSAKGNPAHKRMSNPNLKARRGVSWARGQRKKSERVTAQAARESANIAVIRDSAVRAVGHEQKRPSKLVRAIRRAEKRAVLEVSR